MKVILQIARLAADIPFPSGTFNGRQLFSRLVAAIPEDAAGGLLVLDFDGVAHASASFLRESVLAFRDYVRRYLPECYPVVANVEPLIKEELLVLLSARREALPICKLSSRGHITSPGVLGDVEPALARTLEVLKDSPATLPELVSGSEERVVKSAWSNRLAALINMGLVAAEIDGRGRRYRFVLDAA
jgi:hypothetical protein